MAVRKWLISGLLVLGLAALPYSCISPPLMIYAVKVMPQTDCVILEWSTSVDAHCKVVECDGSTCCTLDVLEDFTTCHTFYALPSSKMFTIKAFDRRGTEVRKEVTR